MHHLSTSDALPSSSHCQLIFVQVLFQEKSLRGDCLLLYANIDWGQLILWQWQNGFLCPVLKHGPRSPMYMRVQGWQTCVRNESIIGWTRKGHNLPASIPREKGLSVSMCVGTRKMVNYAWIGWSQGKLWWRFVAVLTCKSIVKFGHRGERPIEPSSSWFPPKFPSG